MVLREKRWGGGDIMKKFTEEAKLKLRLNEERQLIT